MKNPFRRGTALVEVTLKSGTKIRFRCKDFSYNSHQTSWTSVSNRKRLISLPPDNIEAVVRIR